MSIVWKKHAPVAAVLLAACYASADTVTLRNGDRLSGNVTGADARAVTLESPYLGKLSLDRQNIRTVATTHPVHVADADGSARDVYFVPSGDGLSYSQAATQPATPVAAAPGGVTAPAVPTLASPPVAKPAEAEHPRTHHLDLGPYWKNQLDLGFTNVSGNNSKTEFVAGLDLHYTHRPDELEMKFAGGYGTGDGAKTDDFVKGDVIYRRDLSPRWYGYAENHDLYDGVKGISFRTIDSIGAGYYFFRGEPVTLDLRAGPGITYQRNFDDTASTDPTGLIGLRASYKVNAHISLSEEALYTVSLTDASRYVISSETAMNFKLDVEKGLGVKLAFRDDYDNDAPVNSKPNDTRFIAALTLSF